MKTGDYALRKKLLKKYPASILDVLQLQSLGPKKVAFLWSTFKAGTVADVERIAKEGKLRDLPGFGEKSDQNILRAVEVFKKSSGRFHIDTAEAAAAAVVAHIEKAGQAVESVTPAGSLRRGKETVGDLDLLVTLADGHTSQKHVDALAQHILAFPDIDQTLAHGENKVSFTLENGLQVDVRMLEKENFGAALLYFTGTAPALQFALGVAGVFLLVASMVRLARYALMATPLEEIAELPIASRPATRKAQLSIEDLRAIPWVFSWAQSRHGLPGWFGLGTALEALIADEGIDRVHALYRDWPFFQALVDNAQIALIRSDMDVAAEYAKLAEPELRSIFDAIVAEHRRTVAMVLQVTGEKAIMEAWPTIAATVRRRNPYVDLVSHAQVTLMQRLRATAGEERERIRRVLFVTINGIAAGLQTAG